MYTKQVTVMGQPVVMACDGHCAKAWGVTSRPRVKFDPDEPDDYAFLADGELGDAPSDPGTHEGWDAKPTGPDAMNKWCFRECERSDRFKAGEPPQVRDLSVRLFNQPWKHAGSEP